MRKVRLCQDVTVERLADFLLLGEEFLLFSFKDGREAAGEVGERHKEWASIVIEILV